MVIEDTPERVTLRCQVRGVRTPIRIVRDMTVVRGVAAVQLNETFTNEAHHDIDVMWGHHIAYGLPFLTHGAKIHTSAQHIHAHNAAVEGPNRLSRSGATGQWPIIAGRDGTPFDASVIPPHAQAHGSDVMYLSDYKERNAWYCLYSHHYDVGVAVSWDAQVFTHVWFVGGIQSHHRFSVVGAQSCLGPRALGRVPHRRIIRGGQTRQPAGGSRWADDFHVPDGRALSGCSHAARGESSGCGRFGVDVCGGKQADGGRLSAPRRCVCVWLRHHGVFELWTSSLCSGQTSG